VSLVTDALRSAYDAAQLADGSLHLAAHPLTMAEGCLIRNEWICGEYLTSRKGELAEALGQHALITAASVLLAVAVAVPLALAARRWGWLEQLVLGASTVVYTVPSLALFSLLLPFTGLSASTVVLGLVLYSLTVLVRAFVAGLAAVPPEVIDAARGMGYGPARLLWQVRFPLALPSMMAGVRVAAVSTVALTTVGAIIGYGGLGDLIYDGLRSLFRAQVLTASVLCVLLALVVDLLLLGAQRLATPWRRGRPA
jgi:osmoprotectant transport system permease protein